MEKSRRIEFEASCFDFGQGSGIRGESAVFRFAAAALVLFWCCFRACAVEGAEYHVSPTGDDSAAGSVSSPWRTIGYAAGRLSAGDALFARGGVYNETVKLSASGTGPDNWITIAAYPGEKPVVDATGLPVSWETGLFSLQDVSYVKIDGFELRNLTTDDSEYAPAGVWIFGASHHIEISNNLIHGIENNNPDGNGNALGIAVYGTDRETSVHDILIDGNEIRDCVLGSSESMALTGNVENFTVSNNVVHDNDNIGIDFGGREGACPDPSKDMARDGVCVGNTVYNIDSSGNPAYHGARAADGIYVDGGVRIVVERNTVYDCNIGIELASENAGYFTEDVVVRNNFVFRNHIGGIFAGGYDTLRGGAKNCRIVHNTLCENDSLMEGNGELCLQFDVRNVMIENNIFVANAQSLFVSNFYAQNTGTTANFNVYYGPGGEGSSEWQWKGVAYSGFPAWKSATGNDADSLFADPLLKSPASGDLHIAVDSPARDAGTDLGESVRGFEDIDGDDRFQNGAADIGADETPATKTIYVSATDPDCGQHSPCRAAVRDGLLLCEQGMVNVVKVEQGHYPEELSLEAAREIFLQGGYAPDFESNPDTSSVSKLSIAGGKLNVENLAIR